MEAKQLNKKIKLLKVKKYAAHWLKHPLSNFWHIASILLRRFLFAFFLLPAVHIFGMLTYLVYQTYVGGNISLFEELFALIASTQFFEGSVQEAIPRFYTGIVKPSLMVILSTSVLSLMVSWMIRPVRSLAHNYTESEVKKHYQELITKAEESSKDNDKAKGLDAIPSKKEKDEHTVNLLTKKSDATLGIESPETQVICLDK